MATLADEIGEKHDDLRERKIADAREQAKDERSDDDHDGGVAQFGLGGPGGFLKLTNHFTEEDASAAERIFHSGNLAGAEGIEPPTNGFGDRYSTN
jgi:hypothetical protein